MTKRMLIDASHAEETRVVVLDGNRLEDYDVETATKKHLKGNIYLAKVVRVEPSLQAAFVEFGGNRHGFLPFGEIHPDYYQIPKADRERLIALAEEEARAEEAEDEDEDEAPRSRGEARTAPRREQRTTARDAGEEDRAEGTAGGDDRPDFHDEGDRPDFHDEGDRPDPRGEGDRPDPHGEEHARAAGAYAGDAPRAGGDEGDEDEAGRASAPASWRDEAMAEAAHSLDSDGPGIVFDQARGDESGTVGPHADEMSAAETSAGESGSAEIGAVRVGAGERIARESGAHQIGAAREQALDIAVERIEAEEADGDGGIGVDLDAPLEDVAPPETIGGESEPAEEARERRPAPRFMRNYKIQEVIRRRQILLIQVVKEERKTKDGYKGASLTTYISLAGRFCVLMPNSPRGGGISRKITSAADRRRLKEITTELDIPRGMGMIVRTAGAARPKPEIVRDCEYLLRLWDDIRNITMQSVAPALIYEEASLIKRAIRDVYSRDIEEILVDGEDGWKAARDFMRTLMPAHARKVQLWRDGGQPLFARQQVEAQLDQMLSPTVQLRSGGYLVIDQTEALVAIDVNSGRSTRERGIEETALRTNLEAAEEVARQLRLRDLAGIIVIDFIDMESKRNNAMVERRIKDALKNDRARIQVGQISHFGLLEMSRQRLRPSLAETSFVACPHCGGSGHVRSTDSAALHVLRAIEEEGSRRRAAEILVSVASSIAFYILNHKRDRLSEIEERYEMKIGFSADDTLQPPQVRIDRLRPALPPSERPAMLERPMPAYDDQPVAGERQAPGGRAIPIADRAPETDEPDAVEEDDVDLVETAGEAAGEDDEKPVPGETAEEGERRRRRRRRRRRPGARREDGVEAAQAVPLGDMPREQADEGGEQRAVVDTASGEGMTAPALTVDTSADEAGRDQDQAGGVETGAIEGESEDEGARRRRGRRGGRRRRREDEPVAATMPPAPPAYIGPTPADPFAAGGFDLFDVLDEAEQREAARFERGGEARTREPAGAAPAEEVLVPEASKPVVPEPMVPEPMVPEPMVPEPVVPELTVPEPVVRTPVVAEPVVAKPAAQARPEPVTVAVAEPAPAAEPEPEPEPAGVAAVASPPVKPVIVGAEPVAEKRRGWWRR